MAITKKEFRRFTPKEMKQMIKDHNLTDIDIKINSRTSKADLVNAIFKSKLFKAIRKTIKPKAPRKMTEAQKKNLKRFQKVKQQVDIDKVKTAEPESFETSVESERVQKDYKMEKVIKPKAQYMAEIAKYEQVQAHEVAEPTLKEIRNETLDENKLEHKIEQDLIKGIALQKSGEETLKIQSRKAEVSQRGLKKEIKEESKPLEPTTAFLSDLQILQQQDPQNPIFAFIELLRERKKETSSLSVGTEASPVESISVGTESRPEPVPVDDRKKEVEDALEEHPVAEAPKEIQPVAEEPEFTREQLEMKRLDVLKEIARRLDVPGSISRMNKTELINRIIIAQQTRAIPPREAEKTAI